METTTPRPPVAHRASAEAARATSISAAVTADDAAWLREQCRARGVSRSALLAGLITAHRAEQEAAAHAPGP